MSLSCVPVWIWKGHWPAECIFQSQYIFTSFVICKLGVERRVVSAAIPTYCVRIKLYFMLDSLCGLYSFIKKIAYLSLFSVLYAHLYLSKWISSLANFVINGITSSGTSGTGSLRKWCTWKRVIEKVHIILETTSVFVFWSLKEICSCFKLTRRVIREG